MCLLSATGGICRWKFMGLVLLQYKLHDKTDVFVAGNQLLEGWLLIPN
jgi:hypothetical protein